MTRLLVVLALLVTVGAVSWAWRARRARLQRVRSGERLPPELRRDAARTWVVVTTPGCASCEPAAAGLRDLDPTAALVPLDATERPDLACALDVRAAPTVLEADADGWIVRRLAGPQAVMAHLDRR
jgi:hypothetical protein